MSPYIKQHLMSSICLDSGVGQHFNWPGTVSHALHAPAPAVWLLLTISLVSMSCINLLMQDSNFVGYVYHDFAETPSQSFIGTGQVQNSPHESYEQTCSPGLASMTVCIACLLGDARTFGRIPTD